MITACSYRWRCKCHSLPLGQPVYEPPDSPAPAPRVGAFAAPTKASVARTFAVQGPPRVGKTASSREPLSTDFLLTERGLNEDFLTSVCEHCEILGWFAPDVQDRPK
jgi:hypothetical protein